MKITIHRYETAAPGSFEGHVEPECDTGATPGWILYFRADGSGVLYSRRERAGSTSPGAVVGEGVALFGVAQVTLRDQNSS